MKLFTVYFEVNDLGIYTRLYDVFEYSIRKNMPDIELITLKLPSPKIEGKRNQHQIIKQREWTKFALEQNEEYIILDCDMIITGNLFDAFKYDFDIGYTSREGINRKPLNGGMIFGRPTKESELFWKTWLGTCEAAYDDKIFWGKLNDHCKGFAQSALYNTIININDKCNIRKFPCIEWNVCDEEWNFADIQTAKAFHIKSRLRKAIFHGRDNPSPVISNLWRQYERECYCGN